MCYNLKIAINTIWIVGLIAIQCVVAEQSKQLMIKDEDRILKSDAGQQFQEPMLRMSKYPTNGDWNMMTNDASLMTPLNRPIQWSFLNDHPKENKFSTRPWLRNEKQTIPLLIERMVIIRPVPMVLALLLNNNNNNKDKKFKPPPEFDPRLDTDLGFPEPEKTGIGNEIDSETQKRYQWSETKIKNNNSNNSNNKNNNSENNNEEKKIVAQVDYANDEFPMKPDGKKMNQIDSIGMETNLKDKEKEADDITQNENQNKFQEKNIDQRNQQGFEDEANDRIKY